MSDTKSESPEHIMGNGFDSPEEAAMDGFPREHCHVIVARTHGNDAYVLLNTGSTAAPYLYGVNCGRRDGRWFEGASANVPGWESTVDNPVLGTLSMWDIAPASAEMVRIALGDDIVEEEIVEGAYLAVWWGVAEPQDEWPVVTAFRIAGKWIPPTAL